MGTTALLVFIGFVLGCGIGAVAQRRLVQDKTEERLEAMRRAQAAVNQEWEDRLHQETERSHFLASGVNRKNDDICYMGVYAHTVIRNELFDFPMAEIAFSSQNKKRPDDISDFWQRTVQHLKVNDQRAYAETGLTNAHIMYGNFRIYEDFVLTMNHIITMKSFTDAENYLPDWITDSDRAVIRDFLSCWDVNDAFFGQLEVVLSNGTKRNYSNWFQDEADGDMLNYHFHAVVSGDSDIKRKFIAFLEVISCARRWAIYPVVPMPDPDHVNFGHFTASEEPTTRQLAIPHLMVKGSNEARTKSLHMAMYGINQYDKKGTGHD
jgi:hypothetical protein